MEDKALCEEHRIGPHLRFGSGVEAADFDKKLGAWNVTLDDGSVIQATAVVSAVGQLGRPALPEIEGRDDFTGPSWHSARWDHATDLAGKRVAVIGTGASAIQFVPELARTAAKLDIYQRSAPYILPKNDRPYGPGHQSLFDRFPAVRKADRLRVFLYGELLTSGFVVSPKLLAAPMAMWRQQLRVIKDPRLREKCIPDYVMGCKRVLFSNDWYPTLTRSNVELVTDPVDRIAADGLGWLDVRPDVQEAFGAWVESASRTSVWESGCHSWYTNSSGRNVNNWPVQTFVYRHRVRRFDLASYQVTPKPPAALPG